MILEFIFVIFMIVAFIADIAWMQAVIGAFALILGIVIIWDDARIFGDKFAPMIPAIIKGGISIIAGLAVLTMAIF